MRVFGADGRRDVPWRNGRGVTTELAVWPPGGSLAEGFAWRLSSAAVAEDGPFSVFAGVDRVLVLLGDGTLELEVSGERRVLDRPWAMVRFPGDAPTVGRVPRGPVRDLNLMVDRSRSRLGAVSVARDARALGPGLVVVLEGRVATDHGPLGPLDAIRLEAGEELDAAGALVLVASLAETTGS